MEVKRDKEVGVMFSTSTRSGQLLAALASACLLYLATGVAVSNAAFPGRNGMIVYVADHDDGEDEENFSIFKINSDGSRRTSLHVHGYSPSWSASGRKIVFEGDDRGIYKMNEDGSDQDYLADGDTPAWSPNGARIIYHRFGSLYTMHSNGTVPSIFFDDLDYPVYPVWSVRGKIAFEAHNDLEGEMTNIYSINPDGTGLRRLTSSDDNYNYHPDWSPDGSKIVFVKDPARSTGGDIYTMNADGSGVRRLTNNSIHEGHPVWSPDGTKIAFDRGRGIYTMNTDGTNVRYVAEGTLPDWQPLR